MTELFGYLFAVGIGLLLGITGSGGSILAFPIMVYSFMFNPIIAAGYSLFVVGCTSAVGTISNIKKKEIELKTGLLFAIPTVLGVIFSRKLLLPALPETLFYFGSIQLSKEKFMLFFFIFILFISALSILKKKEQSIVHLTSFALLKLVLKLILVGITIGFIGAGGGFLIVPALLKFGQLTARKAMNTSLLIITLNSLIGFFSDLGHIKVDWPFLLIFTSMAIVGIVIGQRLQKKINELHLKIGFGYFCIAMSLFLFIKEFILKLI